MSEPGRIIPFRPARQLADTQSPLNLLESMDQMLCAMTPEGTIAAAAEALRSAGETFSAHSQAYQELRRILEEAVVADGGEVPTDG